MPFNREEKSKKAKCQLRNIFHVVKYSVPTETLGKRHTEGADNSPKNSDLLQKRSCEHMPNAVRKKKTLGTENLYLCPTNVMLALQTKVSAAHAELLSSRMQTSFHKQQERLRGFGYFGTPH